MITSLRGSVLSIEKDGITVGVGGVGIYVHVPGPLKDQSRTGETIFLHTRLIVREDSLTLFGFETREECEFFDLLVGVNGVGPRMAISILSVLNPEAIRQAVFNEQVDMFSRVPGVGKKTAQKILLHLQDRISYVEGLVAVAAMSEVDTEVLSALTALGYSVVEAQAAIQSIPRDASQEVEERLRLALQYFSRP